MRVTTCSSKPKPPRRQPTPRNNWTSRTRTSTSTPDPRELRCSTAHCTWYLDPVMLIGLRMPARNKPDSHEQACLALFNDRHNRCFQLWFSGMATGTAANTNLRGSPRFPRASSGKPRLGISGPPIRKGQSVPFVHKSDLAPLYFKIPRITVRPVCNLQAILEIFPG